jgi:dipeptidyl aminopeptidase/acylaminoacyl peptidase
MVSRRGVIAGAGGLALLAAVRQALADTSPPSLAELYAPPSTASVALSPSGNRLAILRNAPTEWGARCWLELADANDPGGPRKILKLGDQEASSVAWAHENRLMVWITYDVTRKGFPPESITRIVTLSDEGTKPAVMFGNRGVSLQYIHDLGSIIDDLPDDPDNVLMQAWDPRRGLPGLYKVDVNTGAATVLEFGASKTYAWTTQNGVAVTRYDYDRRGVATRIMGRAPGATDWTFIQSITAHQASTFDILGVTERPGVVLCVARRGDEDVSSVRELDLKGMQFGPPMMTPKGVDARGAIFDRRDRLMAMTWRDERTGYVFADEGFRPHYERIEATFGPEHSIELGGVSDDHARWLGVAAGPREPGRFFIYDKNTKAVTELGRRGEGVAAERLGKTTTLRVKTRDGAEITAYLTAPASGKPGPLVVMPHGGPETRDDWGYSTWAQAMAAKGWWVLQPNFRGSGGFGVAFAKAGWRRWGDRMQEDIEDAVAQAIAEHRLDAGRVAIMGASYGGYAALIGAVRRPELYKAAVSLSGVSDLVEMLAWEKKEDDSPGQDTFNFWRTRIGDPVADVEMLARASPARRVAEIRAPILLVHGTWDATVPIAQSRIMAKAMTAAGKKVELWEQKREGHGASSGKIDRETLARCLTFLEAALA